jgi:hypothetical protein
MRAAPPVSVRCTGGPGWRAVQTALPALAAGVVAFWLMTHAEAAPAFAGALAAIAALCAAALAWRGSRAAAQMLAWDGQHWTLDGQPGRLDLMIDFDAWLLLRLRPEAGIRLRWAAVTAGEAGPAWHGLRAALHAWVPEAAPDRATGEGLHVGR